MQSPARGFCELTAAQRDESNLNRGLWSCDELHEEREGWLWVLARGSKAKRAECMPNGKPRVSEDSYHEIYERIRRGLH